MKVAVKYFYKEIEYISIIIGRLSVVDELIKAAKQQKLDEMELIVKDSKKHHPEFWNRVDEFFDDYDNEELQMIFGESNEYYSYDSTKINPLNIVCLCAISNTVMNQDTLFEDYRVLKKALQEAGYCEIADYIENYYANALRTTAPSVEIGELVLQKLKDIDQIAYIRFASVYKEFTDAESFSAVIGELNRKL